MVHKLLLAENYLIIALFLFFPSIAEASFSLDVAEMYRQIVLDEKIAKNPSLAKDDSGSLTNASLPKGKSILKITRESSEEEVFLKAKIAKEKRWKEIIIAVQNKNPTPFDVAEIEALTAEGDGEATELLAWMNATGTGIKKDLPKAWLLYTEAARLGIAGASANADAIYKALSQRKKKQSQ